VLLEELLQRAGRIVTGSTTGSPRSIPPAFERRKIVLVDIPAHSSRGLRTWSAAPTPFQPSQKLRHPRRVVPGAIWSSASEKADR